MPKPMARLITVKVTGKVKLIAVSESVPKKLINQVSTRLKVKSMSIPIIIGVVMRTSASLVEPSTRFWVLFFDSSFI
jgi:hypothetical protein